MKLKKTWTAALCLGLMALVGGPRLSAAAAPEAQSEKELRAKMEAVGWKEITRGVFERQRGPNKFEHLGYGREGLTWLISDLTRQYDALLAEYQSYPSEDLHKVIDHLSIKIAEGKRELRNSKSLANISDAVTGAGCSICYSATSDSYPLTTAQGVGAVADASFNSNCGYSGDTYAYAYARATLNGTTTTHTQEDPHTGTSVTSHAAATVNGGTNCLSNTSSYAQSTALGISYSTSDSNSSCPPPPATISGPATASITGTNCQTLTWTATTNGGTSPFTYAWTIDGTAVPGSSSSVSKSYCGNGTAHSQTVSVGLTLTDASSQSAASAPFSTAISYTVGPTVSISGPTSVYWTSSNCTTVTWSASVTGGTSPYTYAWTIDGTSAGTGSYASRTYCNGTDQDVSVALTVVDAASQSGSATYSTYVYVAYCGRGINCNLN